VQRNHERILGAAAELFARHGVETSLDEVAAAAGVGVGTVYRHFATKDALLDELFEGTVAELVLISDEALANPDPWAGFVHFVESVAEAFATNRALEDVLRQANRGRERLAAAREQLAAPVTTLVERAKAGGQLPSDFQPADVALIHAMVIAVIRDTEETRPGLWRRYFALILDGLASQARREGRATSRQRRRYDHERSACANRRS
jgi:AcrR family transcriptional regulator